MNTIYQHYIIDMSSNNNFIQIPTVQGDGNGVRGFEVELIQNGQQYVINSSDTIAIIIGTKPDTKEVMNECTITEEGCILVDITSQMSAVAGIGHYQIMLVDCTINNKITSFPFMIITTKSTYDPNYITSTDDFQILTNILAETAEYSKIIETATSLAETAIAKSEEIITSAEIASQSASTAKTYSNNASTSATNASTYESNANAYASSAKTYSSTAKTYSNNASTSATNASTYATQSKSYACGGTSSRSNEDSDNAKYYYEQAKQISEGLNGALLPMGTISFDELSSQIKVTGYMYNISDSFISDSTFKDGGNHTYSEGTNVYYTADGYWDCLASVHSYIVTSETEPTTQSTGMYWVQPF